MAKKAKETKMKLSVGQAVKITVLFGLCCLILGAICGAIVWLVLKIINLVTKCIWEILPSAIGIEYGSQILLVFNIVVCLIGAVIIAFIIRRWGFLPHSMEEALEIFKREGTYSYKKIPLLAFCAIIPLIFGATLGPEAGLTGLIIALCCWVGDSLKVRGKKLLCKLKIKADDNDMETFKDAVVRAGAATVLTTVFATPLAGLVNNLEEDYLDKNTGHKALPKASRIIIYILGIAGGAIAFHFLGVWYDTVCDNRYMSWMIIETGLPRFPQLSAFNWNQLIYLLPLIGLGMLLGAWFNGVNFATKKISDSIKNKFAIGEGKMSFPGALLLTMIAAIIIAVVGYFVPTAMFSGEHQLKYLMEGFKTYTIPALLGLALCKLALAPICYNFGWKGGLIFPIIFSGVALGLGLSLWFGVNSFYAAAVTAAATYAVHSKRPAVVIAILLLVFPISYLPYTIVSAIVSSFVTNLISKRRENKKLKAQN